MKSSSLAYAAYYLTYCILINPSEQVAVFGEKVRDAIANEFPFVVSIEMRGHKGSNFCVGTLISHQSVLTAAHCLFELRLDQVDIMIGSNNLQEGEMYQPKSWISYDQWINISATLELSRNDIAVITLAKRVESRVPASLLMFSREDLDYSRVRIAGWGLSERDERPFVLKTAVLHVIPNELCERKIAAVLSESLHIRANMFCSLAIPWVLGSCGDSGAPILNKRNHVVGIHRGVCPESLRKYNFPPEIVNQHLVNVHLHLLPYRRFINDVKLE